MIRFANPELLGLLALVPVLIGWWWWRGGRRRATVVYSSIDLVAPLRRTFRQRLWWLPGAMHAAALACTIVALARPQEGFGEVATKARGVAMTFVIDRSWSMSQQIEFDGGRASRIDVLRRLFKDFVQGDGRSLPGRPEDMIGLVTFARYADTVCPLTRSHDTLVTLVDRIELAQPDGLEAGTAIGDGLALAVARLRTAEQQVLAQNEGKKDPDFVIKSKVIVLMSDGAENVGEIRAVEAARIAQEAGIKVYAIGIGGRVGRVVNTPFGRQRTGPEYVYDGRTLRAVAQESGGAYFEAESGQALREIYAEIDRLEKTEVESHEFTTYDEQFEPWAMWGVGLLALGVVLRATALRRGP